MLHNVTIFVATSAFSLFVLRQLRSHHFEGGRGHRAHLGPGRQLLHHQAGHLRQAMRCDQDPERLLAGDRCPSACRLIREYDERIADAGRRKLEADALTVTLPGSQD